MATVVQTLCRNARGDVAMKYRDLAFICSSAIFLIACSEQASIAPENAPVEAVQVEEDSPQEHHKLTEAEGDAVPAFQLDTSLTELEQILELSKALGYHQGLSQKCESGEPNYLAEFLSEIQASNLDENTQTNAMFSSTDHAQQILMEEAEYVCTPEMIGQINANAEQALMAWDTLKAEIK